MSARDTLHDFRLNESQVEAATWEGEHLLVLAGPGAGKTRTIIGRTLHLLRSGVEPSRLLCLTFTRRAAGELKERLERHVGVAARKVVAGTFHHFALMSMRRKADWFAMRDKTVIDQDDSVALFKAVCGQLEASQAAPKPAKIASWYSYARNCQLSLDDYFSRFLDVSEADQEYIRQAIQGYKERKKASGYLDFDDLLFYFALGLKKNATIRDWIKRRFEHVLVDEMQDTNPLQWMILDAMRDPAKLFCVGDDAQSIYAFRGADFRNVHSFQQRVPNSDCVRLDLNYRSYQEILDVANSLLAASPLGYDKHLRAERGSCGKLPCLVDFDSQGEEADWIADQILERHRDGQSWREHLILTRAMYLARSIETSLLEKRIPYVVRGGRTFLQAAHIKDVLALIRGMVSQKDELAWLRFLELWPGIGERSASRISHRVAEDGDLVAALAGSRASKEVGADIQETCRQVLQQIDTPRQMMRIACERLEPLLAEKYRDDWDQRKTDLELLESLAGRFKTPESFLDITTIDPAFSSQSQSTDETDVVTLATIHAAKGSEATTCFICRGEPGNYPYHRSLGDEDEVEEERRVFYVALTRAKDELFVSRSLRFDDRRLSLNFSGPGSGVSDFVTGLPQELLEHRANLGPADLFADWESDLIDD